MLPAQFQAPPCVRWELISTDHTKAVSSPSANNSQKIRPEPELRLEGVYFYRGASPQPESTWEQASSNQNYNTRLIQLPQRYSEWLVN